MRKFALVIALGITLAGCNLPAIFTASTASISNPVTPTMLYDVENAATIAFAGLNAYKKSCVDLVLLQTCRGVIQKIQVYTRKIPPVLKNLRAFVRDNDQVNAVLAYNLAMSIMADLKTVAASNNVQVQ